MKVSTRSRFCFHIGEAGADFSRKVERKEEEEQEQEEQEQEEKQEEKKTQRDTIIINLYLRRAQTVRCHQF